MTTLARERTIAIYDRYQRLSRALWERGRLRIYNAHPQVGMDTAFHLAHNWGGAEAQRQLDYHHRLSAWISRRGHTEYRRAEHREHIAENKIGFYLWCAECRKGE